jgi:hypothetical protein
MTDYLSGWNVGVDPEQSEVLPDGKILQEVTLVLVDTEDHYKNDEPQLRAPVAVTLTPAEARKVAARQNTNRPQPTPEPRYGPLPSPTRSAGSPIRARSALLAPDEPPTDAICGDLTPSPVTPRPIPHTKTADVAHSTKWGVCVRRTGEIR